MNFKSIFKKENTSPVLVLSVICLIVALLMGVVNLVTAPEIERKKEEAANAALKVVLPSATTFEKIELGDDYPEEVKKGYKSDAGYVFETSTSGNKPGIVAMIGIDTDGKVVGVEIISDDETPSYKEKIFPLIVGEGGKYNGKDSSTIKIELVSGSTKSSQGIYKGVKAALSAYAVATGGEVPEQTPEEELPPVVDTVTPVITRTEEEILALAKGMYEGDVTLEWTYVYQPDPTTVSVWKNPADESYVLYLATRTQYTPLETEAMIKTDKNGTVLDINLLTWKVGHGVDYTPEYLNSFVGKNKYSTDDITLVSGATASAGNLVAALESALYDVFGNVAMSEEDILRFAKETAPAGDELIEMTLPENSPVTVKKMYKLGSGRGYIFYTVTSTQYVAYETEAFIYSDINGKVMNVNLVNWTVGHGVAPSDELLDSFIGKTAESFEPVEAENLIDTLPDIELVAGATATSSNLSLAIGDALSLVPEHVNYSLIAGIILIVAALSVIGAVVYFKIIKRRKI